MKIKTTNPGLKVSVWDAIINIFRNQLVKAYPKATDNTINLNSTLNSEKDKKKKEKKGLRKWLKSL